MVAWSPGTKVLVVVRAARLRCRCRIGSDGAVELGRSWGRSGLPAAAGCAWVRCLGPSSDTDRALLSSGWAARGAPALLTRLACNSCRRALVRYTPATALALAWSLRRPPMSCAGVWNCSSC